MKTYIVLIVGVWLTFSPLSSASAAESFHSDIKKTCTITRIEGPLVETTCQSLFFGEEVIIRDMDGVSILPNQIPLPCPAEIEISCSDETNCTSIVSIVILKKIKILPE